MKFIQKFNENKINPILNYLPDDKLKESTEIFENLVDSLLSFIDQDFEVSFSTAYGSQITIKYNDYIVKNSRWVEFINGFPVRGYFITITIIISYYDMEKMADIMKSDCYEFLERIELYKWVNKESGIKLRPEDNKMFINFELKRLN